MVRAGAWTLGERELVMADLLREVLRLRRKIRRLEARLYPCKGGCFRRATHGRKDIIFGQCGAELCSRCAEEQSTEEGSTWVRVVPRARP